MELDGREDINDEGVNRDCEKIVTAYNDSSKACFLSVRMPCVRPFGLF